MTASAVADPVAQAQRERFAPVRQRLSRSALARHGGVLVTRLFSAAEVDALRADALAAHAGALEAHVVEPSDVRGEPDRWLESAPGGAALSRASASPRVLGALARLTDVGWTPAGETGSWSYYRRAGHHLGLHRDLAVCDLAVITCVIDEGGGGTSGVLRLWPTRAHEPLAAVRDDPRGGFDLRLPVGCTAVLLGGVVPHRLLPLAPGHLRVVAPICYQVRGTPSPWSAGPAGQASARRRDTPPQPSSA